MRNNQGKFLIIGTVVLLAMVISVALMVAMTTRNTTDVQPLFIPGESATEAEWKEFKDAAVAQGYFTEAQVEEIIADVKAEKTIEERERAREAALGTWQEAVANGTVTKEDLKPATNRVTRYYDVTGDMIPDFEIIFKDGKPFLWRFADENGDGYG